ncbi:MAG: hemolysin XhlA family protein [Clostridium sp.]
MENNKIIQEFTVKLSRIEVLLEQNVKNNDLKIELLKQEIKVANNRILDLEKTLAWVLKAIIGGLISGGIGLLFIFNK